MERKNKIYYRISLTALIIICGFLGLMITSCTKQDPQPAFTKPSETKPVENKSTETKYQGKILEARDYLLDKGIDPSEAVTKISDGDEIIITWDDLCNNKRVIMLDAFLNKEIANISSQNNYSAVTLRSVIFRLSDQKTLAEIYFHKDKILGGTLYPEEDISSDEKSYRSLEGKTLAQIRQIEYPIWQGDQTIQKPAIYYLLAKQALKDGFERAVEVQTLDQGRVLITFTNEREKRVYVYNTKDGSDFYAGISTNQDYLMMRTKQLEGNRTAVFLEEKILIVESKNFTIIEEIRYPKNLEIGVDDLDISRDGETIVYGNRDGLTLSDKLFQNQKIIVQSKIGKDPHGQDWEVPRYPIFSPGSEYIMYRLCGYEWLVGTGIISIEGKDHRYFKADEDETTFISWFDNTRLYSNGPAYGDYRNPVLHDIETNEETKLIQNAPKDQRIEYLPGKDGQIFYQKRKVEENDILELGYYLIGDSKWHSLMKIPGLYQIDLYQNAYDKVNNTFFFIVNNSPLESKPAILVGLDP